MCFHSLVFESKLITTQLDVFLVHLFWESLMTFKLSFINLLNLFIEWPGLSRDWRKLFDCLSPPPVKLVLSVYSSISLEKISGMFFISSGHPQATEKSSSGVRVMQSPVQCHINVVCQVLQTVLLKWSWLGFRWEEIVSSPPSWVLMRDYISHTKTLNLSHSSTSQRILGLCLYALEMNDGHMVVDLGLGTQALQVLLDDLAPHFRMQRFQDTYLSKPLECRKCLIKQLATWDSSYLTLFNQFQKSHLPFLGYSLSYRWLLADECHCRLIGRQTYQKGYFNHSFSYAKAQKIYLYYLTWANNI